MYKTDTGSYKLFEPVFFLPIATEKEELYNKIFESLSSSKTIKNPGIDTSKELLKSIKESSFKSLYKNSSSCMIGLKTDEILLIEPQIYSYEIRALIEDENRVEEINLNMGVDVVIEKIIDKLS